MRNILVLAAIVLFGGFAMTLVEHPTAQAADKSKQVLRHIVLYKFKDESTPAQVQEVIDTFAALPKKMTASSPSNTAPTSVPKENQKG